MKIVKKLIFETVNNNSNNNNNNNNDNNNVVKIKVVKNGCKKRGVINPPYNPPKKGLNYY